MPRKQQNKKRQQEAQPMSQLRAEKRGRLNTPEPQQVATPVATLATSRTLPTEEGRIEEDIEFDKELITLSLGDGKVEKGKEKIEITPEEREGRWTLKWRSIVKDANERYQEARCPGFEHWLDNIDRLAQSLLSEICDEYKRGAAMNRCNEEIIDQNKKRFKELEYQIEGLEEHNQALREDKYDYADSLCERTDQWEKEKDKRMGLEKERKELISRIDLLTRANRRLEAVVKSLKSGQPHKETEVEELKKDLRDQHDMLEEKEKELEELDEMIANLEKSLAEERKKKEKAEQERALLQKKLDNSEADKMAVDRETLVISPILSVYTKPKAEAHHHHSPLPRHMPKQPLKHPRWLQ